MKMKTHTIKTPIETSQLLDKGLELVDEIKEATEDNEISFDEYASIGQKVVEMAIELKDVPAIRNEMSNIGARSDTAFIYALYMARKFLR